MKGSNGERLDRAKFPLLTIDDRAIQNTKKLSSYSKMLRLVLIKEGM